MAYQIQPNYQLDLLINNNSIKPLLLSIKSLVPKLIFATNFDKVQANWFITDSQEIDLSEIFALTLETQEE